MSGHRVWSSSAVSLGSIAPHLVRIRKLMACDTVFLLIIAVLSSITMLALPLVHERNGKLRDLSRGLRGLRPSFLINGSQTVLLAILA